MRECAAFARFSATPLQQKTALSYGESLTFAISVPSACSPWVTTADDEGTAVAPSLTRLKLSAADGSALSVQSRTTPFRFTLNAPPQAANAGRDSVPVCLFWDPQRQVFSGEGTAALPSGLPVGHSVAWAALGAPLGTPLGTPLPGSSSPAGAAASSTPALLPPVRRDAPGASDCGAISAHRPAYPEAPSCAAKPDAEMLSVLSGPSGSAAAARLLPVAWDITGELLCGCSVTVLVCADEDARAAAAAEAATLAGKGRGAADAAALAARRRVYPTSPREALLLPAVACPAGSNAVLKVFYGPFPFYLLFPSRMLNAACALLTMGISRTALHQNPPRLSKTPRATSSAREQGTNALS